jgi:hypothetical protein
MGYYIREGDIDMAIKDWEDDWKIPSLTQEIPTKMAKEEVKQAETHPIEVPVPKKWRMGQTKMNPKNEGSTNTGTHNWKKNTMQSDQVQ